MGATLSSLKWPGLFNKHNNKQDEYKFGEVRDLSNARSYGRRLPRKRPEATPRQPGELYELVINNPFINKNASWNNYNPRARLDNRDNQASNTSDESNTTTTTTSRAAAVCDGTHAACSAVVSTAATTTFTISDLAPTSIPTAAPITIQQQAPRQRRAPMPRWSAPLPAPIQPPTPPPPQPLRQRLPSPNSNTLPWHLYTIHPAPPSLPYKTIDLLSFSSQTLLQTKNRIDLLAQEKDSNLKNKPPFTHVVVSFILIRKTWVGAPAPRNSPASDQTSTPENLPYHHDTGTKRDILLLRTPPALASSQEYILPTTLVLPTDPSIKHALRRELFTQTGMEGNKYIELGFSELEAWDGEGGERGVWLCYGMEIWRGNSGRRGDGIKEREKVGENGWWVGEEEWKGCKMGEGMRGWVKVKLGMMGKDEEEFKR